jgi:hypothetical protein
MNQPKQVFLLARWLCSSAGQLETLRHCVTRCYVQGYHVELVMSLHLCHSIEQYTVQAVRQICLKTCCYITAEIKSPPNTNTSALALKGAMHPNHTMQCAVRHLLYCSIDASAAEHVGGQPHRSKLAELTRITEIVE